MGSGLITNLISFISKLFKNHKLILVPLLLISTGGIIVGNATLKKINDHTSNHSVKNDIRVKSLTPTDKASPPIYTRGATGLTGPKGDRGEKGDKGDKGDTGSIPSGTLRLLDLGTINFTDTLNGPLTLYTTAVGEVMVQVLFVFGSTVDPGPTQNLIFTTHPNDATEEPNGLWFAAYYGEWQDTSNEAFSEGKSWPIQSGTLYAAYMDSSGNPGYVRGAWQANHTYTSDGNLNNDQITAVGHVWVSGPGGTSGTSSPNFSGNIGGTVSDNGITWTDLGDVPTTGSVHVLLQVATPVNP